VIAASLEGYATLDELNSLILRSDGRLVVICDRCIRETSGMVLGVSSDLCDICQGIGKTNTAIQLAFDLEGM